MDRREGARVSPGRIFLTEMVPGIFAVPDELSTLPRRDAIVRVNEFQLVTERLKELVQMPREDLQKERYSAVMSLKAFAGNKSVLTILDIFNKIKEEDKKSPQLRVQFDTTPDVQGTQQQMFSMRLVNGYVQYLSLLYKPSAATFYRSSINEVIRKDFPDSYLARDLKLQASDNIVLQPSSPPRIIMAIFERDEPVTFEEALAEGQSVQEDLPVYGTFIELAELLNKFNIEGELRNKIILYDQNMAWDASVILSYIVSGTPLQKEFATFFLEEGKNTIDQLSADEREKRRSADTVGTIFEVLNEDSLNKKLWWMFAPYLFDELRRNRQAYDIPFDPMDALKRILLWAATAKAGTSEETSILGVGQLYISDFRLSSNPDGASHRFVRRMAKSIAETLLLQQDQFNPERAFL